MISGWYREELVDLVLLDVLETMGLVLKVNQVNQDRLMDWCPEEPHPKGMLVLLVFLALTVVLEIPDPSVHRDLLHAKLLFRDRLVRLVRPVRPVHPEDLSNKVRNTKLIVNSPEIKNPCSTFFILKPVKNPSKNPSKNP